MSDRTDELLVRVRADALRDVLPPGVDQVRRTVHRRRGITAAVGAAAAVALVGSGIAIFGAGGPASDAAPSADHSTGVDPMPDARLAAVSAALGDPNVTPWVMATASVLTADYENDVNDMPADDYRLFVYCIGRGEADVVVKAGFYGDKVLATGSVSCGEQPEPAKLAVRQPVDGYLRVFLKGDAQASGSSVFSFKFVRTAELTGQ